MSLKLKIPPPVVAVFCALIIWVFLILFPALSFDFPSKTFVALALGAVGLAIEAVAVSGFFKRRTTINPLAPSKTSALVTDGLYAMTRNPMYLGMIVLLTAFALYIGSIPGLIVPLFAMWYLTTFQIMPEEEILREKFGEDYRAYCTKVRRWL